MSELQKFKEILTKKGASITKPRLAVFSTLSSANEPLKTGSIAKLTPEVDRTSVYRTLELFSKLHITTTITRGWTTFTELAEPFKEHHHHIICRNCKKTESIESESLEDILQLTAAKFSYTLEHHTVELTGLCNNCQKKNSAR